jgi:hypothetical protein
MRKRKYSKQAITNLITQLQAYKAGMPPYDSPWPGSDTPWGMRVWWTCLASEATSVIVNLAVLLLDVVPHSAAPERLFSMLGWFHSKLRNRLTVGLTGMMAVTRHHLHQIFVSESPRPRKRARTAAAAAAAGDDVEPIALDDSDGDAAAASSDDEADETDEFSEQDIEDLQQLFAETFAEIHAAAGDPTAAVPFGTADVDRLFEPFTSVGIKVTLALLDPFGQVPEAPRAGPLGGLGSQSDDDEDAFDLDALIAASK